MKPIVTILIDTYNYGRFIDEAIQSALTQTLPTEDVEIIVVDDGSKDDTPERVKKYKDKIKYIYKDNSGQASAFNIGVKESRGDYLIFLDSDDYMAVDRAERVLKEFESYKEVVSVLNGRRIVLNDKILRDEKYPELHNIPLNKNTVQYFIEASYGTSRSAFRKSALDKIFPIPEKGLEIEADLYLNLVMFFIGNLSCLKEPLTNYRIHGENRFHLITKDKLPVQIETMKVALQRIKEKVIELDPDRFNLLEELLLPFEIEIKEKTFVFNIYEKRAKRKEAFLIERLKFKLNKKKWSLFYKCFKMLTMIFIILLPPSIVWKLKNLYYQMGFHKRR